MIRSELEHGIFKMFAQLTQKLNDKRLKTLVQPYPRSINARNRSTVIVALITIVRLFKTTRQFVGRKKNNKQTLPFAHTLYLLSLSLSVFRSLQPCATIQLTRNLTTLFLGLSFRGMVSLCF